ncbi:SAM-dependent methyltransferase [Amycolatopsis sp. NPDC004079]|uniref:SAM-dependent methyltransferase n=1 Tax=Amycolatopsis sp. NPDC004079 TaxID=3154549 RepID=UPI0033AC159E
MNYAVAPPPGVDTTRASVARVYDYYLGGKDHYEIDRKMAADLERAFPEVAHLARDNRHLLTRICRFIAYQTGIRQYIDCGSGLPTAENVHQIVQRADSTARVVYVDYDPVVTAHGLALLVENDFTDFIQADIYEPERILHHPTVDENINWNEPVAVLFLATLHHQTEDPDAPAAVTKAFIDRMPSGSYLAISHLLDPRDGSEDEQTVNKLLETVHNGPMRDVMARTRAQIRELFHDMEMVPSGPGKPAGIVHSVDWWPDGPMLRERTIAQQIMVAGVARKP